MSSYECKLPENTKPLPNPTGRSSYTVPYVPELEFPRKLKDCNVRIWYGSEFRGLYSTIKYEMWLLAPNVIKMDNGASVWVEYNVTIQVEYHKYPKKE